MIEIILLFFFWLFTPIKKKKQTWTPFRFPDYGGSPEFYED